MVGSHAPLEGSIAVSLRELERLEADRVREQRDAERRRREADEAAAREVVRRAEEERADRERRAEEAWAARERAERDDAVRATAIERAAVERARTEATEHERERAHQREMELTSAMRAGAYARLRRVATVLAVALVGVVLAGAAVYVAVLAPSWERTIASMKAELATRDDRIAEVGAKLGESEAAVSARRRELDDASRRVASLEADLAAARKEREGLRRGHGAVVSPPVTSVPRTGFDTKCAPDSLDPLCGNLGR